MSLKNMLQHTNVYGYDFDTEFQLIKAGRDEVAKGMSTEIDVVNSESIQDGTLAEQSTQR